MPTASNTTYRPFLDQTLHYFMRDHQALPLGPVESEANWLGRELKDDQASWLIELGEASIDELSSAVDNAIDGDVPMSSLTMESFELPTLATEIAEWTATIRYGRGFVVVRGLPVEAWGEEKAAYAYWGIGHHLGVPGAQNAAEELLGHVKNYGDSGTELVRQYRTTENINFHCDAADVVGLLCLQPAKSGGQSRIVSSVAVFNAMQMQAPQLAARMFQPFPLDRRNEHGPGEPGFVPIQSCCYGSDGVLRTFFHSEYFRSALRHDGAEIDEKGLEALALYDALCHDPDFHLDMWLEQGDMQFISNHTIVHARTAYDDWPEEHRRRHLLRLWLSITND